MFYCFIFRIALIVISKKRRQNGTIRSVADFAPHRHTVRATPYRIATEMVIKKQQVKLRCNWKKKTWISLKTLNRIICGQSFAEEEIEEELTVQMEFVTATRCQDPCAKELLNQDVAKLRSIYVVQ